MNVAKRFSFLGLFFFFCAFFFASLQATDTNARNFTIQSLDFNTPVQCIYQDHLGFLWFGTWNGLYRYDGYETVIYRNDPKNPNSINGDIISSIVEEKSAFSSDVPCLWIGTRYSGIDRFDPQKETWTHFTHLANDSGSLSHNTVLSIIEDQKGILWVATKNGGFHQFDKRTATFSRLSFPAMQKAAILTLLDNRSQNQTIWLGTSKGLFSYRTASKRFARIGNHAAPLHVRALLKDHLNRLWIGQKNGRLIAYDVKTETFVFENNPINAVQNKMINCLLEDCHHFLWVGTDTGLFVLKITKDGLEPIRKFEHTPSDKNSLKSNIVLALYEDRSGVMWVGTVMGVNRINLKIKHFRVYQHHSQAPRRLTENYIKAIHEDRKGRLWIGTLGSGLHLWNRKTEQWQSFKPCEGTLPESTKRIHVLFEDRDGNIWIGTNKGLAQFNPTNGKLHRFLHNATDSNSLGHNSVYTIFQDSEGYLWIGTFTGVLNRYDLQSGTFKHFRHRDHAPNSFPKCNGVLAITEDSSHRLWFGTAGGGLACLFPEDKSSGRFHVFQKAKDTPTSLAHNIVYAIHEDRLGNIWLGTKHGLSQAKISDRRHIEFEHYALPGGYSVLAIEEDEESNLWLSGSRGILKFNTRTHSFKVYDYNDGLPRCNFFMGASFRGRDGRIYFGNTKGLIAFYPQEIKENSHVPAVVFTDFKLFNEKVAVNPSKEHRHRSVQKVLNRSIMYTKKIELTHRQNFFTLKFAALDFFCPAKNQYRYYMEGFNQDWIDLGHKREVSFNNLNPGKYVFHVRGSNNDGVWNEASLQIIIFPPWWRTKWFIVLSSILLAFLMFGFHYLQIRRLRAGKRRQQYFSQQLIESQEAERKRIAADLHDSLGQNLMLISNELLLVKNQNAKLDRHLEPILNDLREAINQVRQISFNLHPHTLERLGLTRALFSVVRRLNENFNTNIELRTNRLDIDRLFPAEKQIHLYRIVQEALNNILKHAHATQATVEFIKKIRYVYLIISDNGIGFKPNFVKQKEFGLSSMKERVRLLNGTMYIRSIPGSGTKILIKLPIVKPNKK